MREYADSLEAYHPDYLITAVLHNNKPAVEANMAHIGVHGWTVSGLFNTLKTMWDNGRRSEVYEIIDVPWIFGESSQPQNFIESQNAQSMLEAYNRSIGADDGFKKHLPATPDPNKGAALAAVILVILIIIFIWRS